MEPVVIQTLKSLFEPPPPLSKRVDIRRDREAFFSESWKLDTPIFRLPTGDDWTLADACQGVLILGATGSGKSSGSADSLALKMLRLGAGGLVLCVKVGEADYWGEIATQAGREHDLIRVTEAEHGFNVFEYELRRCGRGAGLTVNLLGLFRQLQDLIETGNGRKAGLDFWERACIRCIANAIEIQASLDESFTLQGVREIIHSSPQTWEQGRNPRWLNSSKCGLACASIVGRHHLSYDLSQAVDYFTSIIPRMGDKQRAGIFETWEGLADPLLRTPLRQKFCEKTTWTPEDAIYDGKIIIIDLPVKEFDLAGRMAGVIAKFMFQKAVERRASGDEQHRRPCFLWADEFENFATGYDNLFQKTARSSKASTVYIGQNLPGILACMGGTSGEPFMKALLGNLTTKIFHANAEETTNRYAAEAIGRDLQEQQSFSAGMNSMSSTSLGKSTTVNASISQHRDYIVQPIEFTRMRTGGHRNRNQVDAILFKSGTRFCHGKNFVRVSFEQRKRS